MAVSLDQIAHAISSSRSYCLARIVECLYSRWSTNDMSLMKALQAIGMNYDHCLEAADPVYECGDQTVP